MYRITPEGRRFLQSLTTKHGGRIAFGLQVGIGKNQVKPLLDAPDHIISQKTVEKIQLLASTFRESIHYAPWRDTDDCELRLARDRNGPHTLSYHDAGGIERLYDAMLRNPEFAFLLSSYGTVADLHGYLLEWGNISDEGASEQYFVYRVYRDTVITFLYGERRLRTAQSPMTLFAIWYLVGATNAFYDGSPVSLDAEARKSLPIGERLSATSMAIRLLEELRQDRNVDCIFFELDAYSLAQPDSYSRCMMRVYGRAEEEIRQHFAFDPYLKNCQCFVLDVPFFSPRWQEDSQSVTLHPYLLVCCPLKPALSAQFKAGAVPQSVAEDLLVSVYRMYWDYFDDDAPQRRAIQQHVAEMIEQFRQFSTTNSGTIACYTLRDYIAAHFRKANNSR